MKLENNKIDIVGSLSNETKEATISKDHLNKLWGMIENPYKDNIGSIVREITSNCFDSHTEAGVFDAVIIRLTKEDDGFYISFIDRGVGISEERVDKIFLNIFSSTKDTTDEFIGAFGLGSKSPLSYQSHFFINTHVDGTTYNYIYRKGATSPEMDLINKVIEVRHNGTEIKIKIKTEDDVKKFLNAITNQLYYFQNVVVDFTNIDSYINIDLQKFKIDSVFKIYEGDNFKIRIEVNKNFISNFNKLHICNGPVTYPIDTNNIELETHLLYLPIGLKFDIGELDIIQTREDVRYTQKTIAAIKDKLKKAVEELIKLHKENDNKVYDNLQEYYKAYVESNNLVLGSGDHTFKLQNKILEKNKIYYKPFKDLVDANQGYFILNRLFDKLEVRDSINYNETIRVNRSIVNNINNGKCGVSTLTKLCYLNNHDINILKDKGLFAISNNREYSNKINNQIIFKDYKDQITKGHAIPIFVDNRHKRDLYWFKSKFNLRKDQKSKWREIINTFIKIENELLKDIKKFDNVIDYDNLKLDEVWYKDFLNKNRKKPTNITKRDNSLISFRSRLKGRWENDNYTLDSFVKSCRNSIAIIESKDDKDNLLKLENDFDTSIGILTSLANTNYDKLVEYVKINQITNIITYKEFLANKYNIKMQFFRKVYKKEILGNFMAEISNIFSNRIFRDIFPNYDKLLHTIDIRNYNGISESNVIYYFNNLGVSYQEVIDYVYEKDTNLVNNINLLKPIYYIFDMIGGYYSTSFRLALFLYYYKPDSLLTLKNKDIKIPSDGEFKQLVKTYKNNIYRIKDIDTINMAMYLLHNKHELNFNNLNNITENL